MRLNLATADFFPRLAFRISRGEKKLVRNVFVQLSADGIVGFGEASPNAFYGETAASTAALLKQISPHLAALPPPESAEEIRHLWQELWPRLRPSRAAQCALDLALWDWLARRRSQTVSELALGIAPRPVTTFCTIGLCGPDELAGRLEEVAGFPRLKIKSDATADLDFVRSIAEATGAEIAIDANCAWPSERLFELVRSATELQPLFLEQPLLPAQDDAMRALLIDSPFPVLADESCATADDVARMPGRFHGFNIKLVKCGGLTPALAMQAEGRRLGLRLMTGCMLESSLLIAAGAVVAAGCDYADLDGAWLLADDPFSGMSFEHGVLTPSGLPGFGVEPRPGLFATV